MTELKDYWKTYTGYVEKFTEWYQSQSGPFQRFMKYGGWIALQFWIIRAPMTVLFTRMFDETITIDLFIHVFDIPGYLMASFTSGTLLAVVGFFLSERWIWGSKTDAV